VPLSPSLNKAVFFIGVLVVFTCSIRSEAVVDRSFLPRVLLLTFLLLFAWISFIRKFKQRQINHLYLISLIGFYLWNLVSALWSIAPSEALIQSQLFFLCLVLFVVVSFFLSDNTGFELIFIKAVIILLLVSFVLAFLKMFSLPFFDPYKIISVSANNNLYAGFLLLSFPLLLAGYKMLPGIWKHASVATGILSLFFLVIVQSRAAYLGMAISVLILSVITLLRFRGAFSRRNIATGSIATVLLLSGIIGFYISLDQTRRNYFLSKVPVWSYFISYDAEYALQLERKRAAMRAGNMETAAFDFSEDYYENANLRIIFWKKSGALIGSHPILGVGSGNWRLAVPAVTSPGNPEHTAKNYTYSQPHNEWIGILAELGLIGLILALAVYFIPPVLAFRNLFRKDSERDLTTSIYASFIFGFFLFSAFDFPLKRVEHNILLFTIFAFIMQKVPASHTKFPIPAGIIRWLPAVVITAILIGTLALVSLRLTGEYFTLRMFMNERKNDEKVIAYCRKAGSPFYRITPNTLPIDWFEGVAHYRMGNAEAAILCFQRALKHAPYEVRVLNDYGTALFSLKRTAEAKAVLLEAWKTDPWFDDAKFNLAAICYLSGEHDSALAWVNRCRDSGKKKDFLKELTPASQK
jgi:tetratricopeptide (TPR) repeat protein